MVLLLPPTCNKTTPLIDRLPCQPVGLQLATQLPLMCPQVTQGHFWQQTQLLRGQEQ